MQRYLEKHVFNWIITKLLPLQVSLGRRDVEELLFEDAGSHSLWLAHLGLKYIKLKKRIIQGSANSAQRSQKPHVRDVKREHMFCINTRVDEASRCSFAELFRFIRQRDLDNPRDVPRRRLNTDGVRCNQLRNEDGSKTETNYFLHSEYLRIVEFENCRSL